MIAFRTGHCISISLALATLLPSLLSSCGTAGLEKPKRLEVVQRSEHHIQSRFEVMGTLSFVKYKGTKYEPAYVQMGARVEGEPTSQFMVWPASAVPYQSLDLSKSYLLEFLEDDLSNEKRTVSTLFRVRDPESRRVLADASLCPLHEVPMAHDLEHGVDGGDYPDSYFVRSGPMAREFPNDGKAYLLCGSGIRHFKWTCPTCRRLSDAWAKRRGIQK